MGRQRDRIWVAEDWRQKAASEGRSMCKKQIAELLMQEVSVLQ